MKNKNNEQVFCLTVPRFGSRELWTYDNVDHFLKAMGTIFARQPNNVDEAKRMLLNKNEKAIINIGLDHFKEWLNSDGKDFRVMLNDYAGD